jgi:hypothetical protein
MIGWAEQNDREPCCESSLGAVADSEALARLIIKPAQATGYTPFQRSEIFGDAKKSVSNVCGEKSGLSVLRCDNLTETQLMELSHKQAQMRPNRSGDGARSTIARILRQIRITHMPNLQIVYVYDDPRDDQICHAVLRGSKKLIKNDIAVVLEDIKKAFRS